MDSETVGQRLRAAREARGLSIEDVAASTRIPTRHLLSLEESDWSKLPAPTYSVGFAKNYAGAVGLDKAEIAEALRGEMGSALPSHYSTAVDTFEPVDADRSMPKAVIVGAIAALIAIALLLSWLNNRELASDDPGPADNAALPVPGAPVAAAPAAQGPVVITANEAAWIEVRDGATILKQGELAAGQSFEVPAGAARPTLTTAKPEALRISVGTGDAPVVGPAGTRVSGVSLLGPDLMRGPAAAPPVPAPVPSQTAPSVQTRVAPAPAPPAAVADTPAAETPPVTQNQL